MDLLCAAIGYLAVCISTCGTHAASYTTQSLMYSTTTVSWNTAYATCSLMSGRLITVDNNVTINVLKYIRAQPEAAAISDKMWIGLHNTAPTSDVPDYVWADCKHLDDNNTLWFPGEPNFVQTDHCMITSPEYEWKTKSCTQTYSFFCENVTNVDCTFEKETGQKCEVGGVLLPKAMEEDECATHCQEDMDGSDVCWVYEYNIISRECILLFGSDPYICETLQENGTFITGRRRCFEFADITGSEVTGPGDLFPNCSTTEVTTSTETPAVTSTTSTIDTTVEAITSTSATTSSTPSMTVTTSITLETTTTTTIPTTAASTPEVTNNVVTSSVTPTVTTTTASSPTAAATTTVRTTATIDTGTPTSTPFSSTNSATAPASNGQRTSQSPSLTTFLSRLEASVTNSRSFSTPPSTSSGRYVYEVCVPVQTFTVAERKKRTDDIVTDLSLVKKNLSSYRRKKSSAEDERPSAQSVGGGVAITLLVTAALIIIMPDCAKILMHVMHVHKKKQLGPALQ